MNTSKLCVAAVLAALVSLAGCRAQDDAVPAQASDLDSDGILDLLDLCPTVADLVGDVAAQADLDGDLVGNACDIDLDGDSITNVADLCPSVLDPLGNVLTQADLDGDSLGDACDLDLDGDGTPEVDLDLDGVPDLLDNCPLVSNLLQLDRKSVV